MTAARKTEQAPARQPGRASAERAGEVIWLDAHRVTHRAEPATAWQARPQTMPRVPRRATFDGADLAVMAVGALALVLMAVGVIR